MSSIYPAGIDGVVQIPTVINNVTGVTADVINRLRDTILLVEAELGIKPSGIYTTVRNRLDILEGLSSTEPTFITFNGVSTGSIPVSGSGKGTIIFNSTINQFEISSNGGAYTLLGSGGSGTFIADGDLSGSNVFQTVIGFQNRSFSNIAPSAGQAIIWDGYTWTPSTNFISQNIITTGFLSSGPANITSITTGLTTLTGKLIVNGIGTVGTLSDFNQGIIYFDGYTFKVSENGSSYSNFITDGYVAGGDLSGTYSNPSVVKIQGNAVANTALSSIQDGYILTWVNSSAQYQAKPAPTGFSAGGDLSGTANNQTVIKIQNNSVANTILGAAQDGYVLTWVNGSSQYQSKPIVNAVAGGGGYVTALDFDFTTQSTQTLGSDTNFTIGGLTWTKINSANDSVAMVVTNGIGLVQKPISATNITGATRTVPGLYITLVNAGVPSPYYGMKIRAWARLISGNWAGNFDTSFFVLESGNNNNLQYMSIKQQVAATQYYGGELSIANGQTATGTGDQATLTDDVYVIEAELGAVGFHIYTGQWSGGWPAASSLRLRDSVTSLTGGAILTHAAGVGAWEVLLAAGRAGSGTALNITWGQLKIDYRV